MVRLSRSLIVYYLYRLAGACVPRIPPRIGYALFGAVGGLVHHINATARANVRSNIRHVLGPTVPEDRVKRLARATFDYVAYNYYDLFRLPTLTSAQVNAMVEVNGWENVEAALSLGRGVVMTSAHFGNIEVVLYAMSLRGAAITIPAERVQPPQLFDYLTALRTSKGLKLIPIDGPMIDLFRTLRRGGVAGIAGDRNVVGEGTPVNFFGQPTRLPDGHVRLAMRTGAPLILGFSRRVCRDRYQASFWPHFLIPQEGSESERFDAGMRYVLRGLEEVIGAHPEQWAITVPFWPDARTAAAKAGA
jgi:phosphatidylinositol dimannoside acyltransferase